MFKTDMFQMIQILSLGFHIIFFTLLLHRGNKFISFGILLVSVFKIQLQFLFEIEKTYL